MKLSSDREVTVFFRDQFREARARVSGDAEAFDQIIFALERLGRYLSKRRGDLSTYSGCVGAVAGCSPLARVVPNEVPEVHSSFGSLYEALREARNDAMHQGAVARHLSSHAAKVALVLEDALNVQLLMSGNDKVKDFMVSNPVCAQLWQPMSFIRQMLLEHSFSHLPVWQESADKPEWKLVSDHAVARYLRTTASDARKKRLTQLLQEAAKEAEMEGFELLTRARVCAPDEPVNSLLPENDGRPVLVVRKSSSDLIGILTAYDLL